MNDDFEELLAEGYREAVGDGLVWGECHPLCTQEVVRAGKVQCSGLYDPSRGMDEWEPCPWGNTPWLEKEDPTSTGYEHFHDGCSVTWDAEVRVGYAHVNPNPDAFGVASTIEVRSGLLVDLDRDGFVRGIETLGNAVGIGELLAVLRHCRLAGQTEGHR